MIDQEIHEKSAWKRHRGKVACFLVLLLAAVALRMSQSGDYAKEKTWELAARLGLSTNWHEWYNFEEYPADDDNVACHPLFAALRMPVGGWPQWNFGPLGQEAQSAFPSKTTLVSLPDDKVLPFTAVLEILEDEKKHPLAPSDVLAATKGIQRITD